ncbi:arc-like DNA binding domain protein [Yersinia rochesterensis]|uniref:Arc-like DNA binding domain protein n=2 Tax=Yersiniaceae TaxID=1903411 RepID=A0ABM5SR67_9GAMM|nr:arc-like DNA binding domain protein [Yersinia frederiksenii Y225]AJJ36959.1 arc-like DNA binding domain protein [Yersinia rochesterensis]CQD56590.1 transcriptional regulator [Yersinia enterocolitica]
MVSVMAEKQVKDYEKFVVRFPDGMRDAIAERAKANGRSMNSEIVQILEDSLEIEKEVSSARKAKESGEPMPDFYEKLYSRLEGEFLEKLQESIVTKLREMKDEDLSNKNPT